MVIFRYALLVLAASAALALVGCASSPDTYGSGVSRVDPLVAMPRVSGSSAHGEPRAQVATQIGNRQTGARLSLRAAAGPRGVEVSPVFRSKYINWQF